MQFRARFSAHNAAQPHGDRLGKSIDMFIIGLAALMFGIWLLGYLLISFIPAEHIASSKARKLRESQLKKIAAASDSTKVALRSQKTGVKKSSQASVDPQFTEGTPKLSGAEITEGDSPEGERNDSLSQEVAINKPVLETNFRESDDEKNFSFENESVASEPAVQDSTDTSINDSPELASTKTNELGVNESSSFEMSDNQSSLDSIDVESENGAESKSGAEPDSIFASPKTNEIDFSKSTEELANNAVQANTTESPTPMFGVENDSALAAEAPVAGSPVAGSPVAGSPVAGSSDESFAEDLTEPARLDAADDHQAAIETPEPIAALIDSPEALDIPKADPLTKDNSLTKADSLKVKADDLYEMRVWISDTGGKATMAFERWDGESHIVFRNEKRQRFRVPLTRLSAKDKAVVLKAKKVTKKAQQE